MENINEIDTYEMLKESVPELEEYGHVTGGMESVIEFLQRYFALLRDGRATIRNMFTESELGLLSDSSCGSLYTSNTLDCLLANVQDCEDAYMQKWQVDRQALQDKLGRLTLTQNAALTAAIEKATLHGKDYRSILQ